MKLIHGPHSARGQRREYHWFRGIAKQSETTPKYLLEKQCVRNWFVE